MHCFVLHFIITCVSRFVASGVSEVVCCWRDKWIRMGVTMDSPLSSRCSTQWMTSVLSLVGDQLQVNRAAILTLNDHMTSCDPYVVCSTPDVKVLGFCSDPTGRDGKPLAITYDFKRGNTPYGRFKLPLRM